jgi:transcriptional regulator with XRE-family HTH domain
MTIAELKRYRQMQGVSQLQLGHRSRVNNRRISMAEHGHITLREAELIALETGLRAVLRDRERRANVVMADLRANQGQGASEPASTLGLAQLVRA